MKIVGLSNGVHIFESEGETAITNCIKKEVTEEASTAIAQFIMFNDIEAVRVEINGKGYFLKLEKEEEDDEDGITEEL